MTDARSVGRPRHHDDESERRLLLDGAFNALRDQGRDFTINDVLTRAGVSTRSFYRHFESKDALLAAMYTRDAEQAASRLRRRLAECPDPESAVSAWIDEIFSFLRVRRRAERVTVLGSLLGQVNSEFENVAASGRDLLVAPLRDAIAQGIASGRFTDADAGLTSELVATSVMHAAGISAGRGTVAQSDQTGTVEFVLRALGVGSEGQ